MRKGLAFRPQAGGDARRCMISQMVDSSRETRSGTTSSLKTDD